METPNSDEIQNSLIKTAIDIRKKVIQLKQEGKNEQTILQIIEQSEFRHFCQIFPLVVHYIVFFNLFDASFFRRVLKIIQTRKKGEEKDMVELQVNYLMRLRSKYLREPPNVISRFREQMLKEMENLRNQREENRNMLKEKNEEEQRDMIRQMRLELEEEARKK
jgi:hypothetical protein